jgi:hypothetical protein
MPTDSSQCQDANTFLLRLILNTAWRPKGMILTDTSCLIRKKSAFLCVPHHEIGFAHSSGESVLIPISFSCDSNLKGHLSRLNMTCVCMCVSV